MIKTKYLFLFSGLLFSFSLAFNSCRKEEDLSKYSNFPLELTYEDVPSGIKLKWNKVNTSDFVQYLIVRSVTDTIPDIKTGTLANSVATVARITDANKTEFIDFATLNSKAYYRVFVQLGNRFVSSRNITPNANIISVPGFTYELLYNPKRKFVYMLDRNNALLNLYDVNKNAVVKSVRVSLNTSNIFYLNLGQFNGNDELQIQGMDASSNGMINIHDPVTLELKDQIGTGFSSSSVTSFCSDNSGTFFAYASSFFSLKAISRTQKIVLSTNNLNNSGNTLRFKKLSDSKIVGMPSNTGYAQLLQFNASGQYASPANLAFVSLISSGTNNPFVVSPFENVFIHGFNGVIYDNQMKFLGQLSTSSIITYRDFAFSDDATKLYAATTSNAGRRQVDVFNLPALNLDKSINTKTFCRNIYNIGNNQLLLVGDGFDNTTGAQTTIFEKIDINK